MIAPDDIIGVGVSGGIDSMVLLHFLQNLQSELRFKLIAIHVDHSIRENSASDAAFVQNYCAQNQIKFFNYKVNVPKYAAEHALSTETAARECRNSVFEGLLNKNIITKIALAHHASDQAETVLMHLFRGSGPSGAKGMSAVRQDVKIRPLLETTKQEIIDYAKKHMLSHVIDESNQDNLYARNFVRNEVLPLIKTRWPMVESALASFAKACAEDTDYIKAQTNTDGFITMQNLVKIPAYCFLLHPALVSRTIFTAFEMLGIEQDIEKKHLELIKNLYENGENGKKISLPGNIVAHKEYEYITITKLLKPNSVSIWMHKTGSFDAEHFGKVTIKKTKSYEPKPNVLLLDADCIPTEAIWRIRQTGDTFSKFGGGTKKLKDYFINIKVPLRERDFVPILTVGNQVLAIAGYEISDAVKVTSCTKNAIAVSVKRY